MRSIISVIAVVLATRAYANPYESGGKVEEHLGAYTDSIPISVPPFHGIEPKLSLEYQSSRGSGLLGVGWSLQGLSVIEQTDSSSPLGTSKKSWQLDGQRLVKCAEHTDFTESGARSPGCQQGQIGATTSTTWYTTLSESYLRIEQGLDDKNVPVFVVWTRDGVKHFYKRPTGSAPRYLLDRVVDPSGNTVTYKWVGRSTSMRFNRPESIAYNGTVISFGYSKRSARATDTFAEESQLAVMGDTLGVIDVCVGEPGYEIPCSANGKDKRRVRAYALSYRESSVSARPLLTQVQMFGKDAIVEGASITGGTSAPPARFTYNDPEKPRYTSLDPTPVWNWGRVPGGMVDFDGDGRADYCHDDSGNPSANMRCKFSRGATVDDKWIGQINDLGDDNSGRWVDWNGDGKSDYCRIVLRNPQGGAWVIGQPRSYRLMCAFSTGTGITDVEVGVPFQDGEQGQQNERWFVDWNGDGKTDYCRAYDDQVQNFVHLYLKCAFSTGTSFVDLPVGTFEEPFNTYASLDDVLGEPETRAMADWNGDGRADLCRVIKGPNHDPSTVKCMFGQVVELDRTQWLSSPQPALDQFVGKVDDYGSSDTQWWVDVNGDGKSDYCRLLASNVIQCGLSTQTGLDDRTWVESDTKFGVAESRRWGDINGDGRADMCFDMDPKKYCVISRGLMGEVVDIGIARTGIVAPDRNWMADWNGDGRVDYCFNSDSAGRDDSMLTCIFLEESTPAFDLGTSFDNGIGGRTSVAYRPSSWFAPGPYKLPVVASLTRAGGAEGPVTQTFEYRSPSYDTWTRRFLGFGWARITDPCISGESLCPYTEITSRMDWHWPTAPSRISRYANGNEVTRMERIYADTTLRPYRSDLVDEKHTEFDGLDAITAQRKHTYDRFGNEIRLDDLGAIADTTGYFGNLGADDRTIISEFGVDQNAYITEKPYSIRTYAGTTKLTEVRYLYDKRGLAILTENWLDTTNKYVASSAVYDAAGNVVSETDPNQHTTSYELDDVYKMYVVKTTNHLGQSTSTPLPSWDVRCGERLFETDQNGTTAAAQFDPLCRKVGSAAPGRGWDTISYALSSSTSYTQVSHPDGTWRRTTFDGLGRTTKIERSGSPTIIEKELTYDARGNVASMTRPRELTAPVFAYTFSYDGRDRETSAVLPITQSGWQPARLTRYTLRATYTMDEMGHWEMTVRDVRGRRWFTGSTDGSTNPRDITKYFYDQRGNLEQIQQPAQQGTGLAITRNGFDSLGRKIWTNDSNAGSHRYEYDAKGNLTAVIDTVHGVTTTYAYDALDRRISKSSPDGTVAWRHDEARAGFKNVGKLTSMDDASGTATYDYDAAGNLVRGGRSVDGTPYTFSKQYDTSGRLLATTYPDGSQVGTTAQPIEYDLSGRIRKIPGIIDSATYDAADQLTSYAAPSGARATYDTANRRGDIASYTFEGGAGQGPRVHLGDYEGVNTASATVGTREFLVGPVVAGQTLTVSTCGASVPGASGSGDTVLRVLAIHGVEIASNDNSTVPGCGALSTVTVRVPLSGTLTVRAGCAGNTRCSGTVMAWLENEGPNVALGKPVAASSALDPTCGPPSSLVDGNPNGVWCASSSMLHTQWQPQPALMIDLGMDQDIRRIDVFNRNDSLCDAACRARLSNYEVMVLAADFAGGWQRVADVAEQAQFPTFLHVNARGRYVLLRLKGSDYLNTPEVRVIAATTDASLTSQPVFERATIQRDLEGRVTRIDSTLARSSWTYGYGMDNEHAHELWSADNVGDPSLSRSSSGDNGNMYFDNRPATYGYGPGFLPHALTQFDQQQLLYDASGHMTWAQGRGTLTWTQTHQLESFGGVTYHYDGEGYRLKKEFAGETKIYLGDDYEISSTGHTKYISLGGRLVAKQVGSAPATTLFTDHLGSVVLGLDGSGVLAFKTSFGPWGETLTGNDDDRGYTGQYKDENGLIYLHARFYDPSIGRFISPDPMISSSRPIGMNRYAYASNDPINQSDIDGLGWFANTMNDLGNALGATAKFVATTNVRTHLKYYNKVAGLKWDLDWVPNVGVGNTLALIFVKFHALHRNDGVGFAKAWGSESVISAAVAATILSYGATYAPLVGLTVALRLPFYLTMIQTGDAAAAGNASLGELGGAIRGAAMGLTSDYFAPLTSVLKADAARLIPDFLKKCFGGGGNVLGLMMGTVMVFVAADPYVPLHSSTQATSVSSQGRLSSGSGMRFGYGYRGE